MSHRAGFSSLVAAVMVTSLLISCSATTESRESVVTTAETEDSHDHDHSDMARIREWDADTPPTLAIEITSNTEAGHTVRIDAPGFVFTGADVFDPVPGEGHAHLYVDGDLVTMAYGSEFTIAKLDPGRYELMVTLSTNDHLEYVVDGVPLSASTFLEVAESHEAHQGAKTSTTTLQADQRIEIEVDVRDGAVHTENAQVAVDLGTTVVLTVTSDQAEEVHIHGYDHTLELHPNEPATFEFTADVPGIFEIELEDSHQEVLELKVG